MSYFANLWQNWANFHCYKWPNIENNLIIWSHCLPTSYLPTYLLLFSQDSSARVFFFCACPINIFLVQFVSLSLIFSTSSISHSLSLLLSQALPSPSLSFWSNCLWARFKFRDFVFRGFQFSVAFRRGTWQTKIFWNGNLKHFPLKLVGLQKRSDT